MDQSAVSPRLRILVAPLDWGLGHTTRCIPLIRLLAAEGCTVVVACAGKTEALLRQEFPQLEYLHLPGYEVEYGRTRWELYAKLLWQLPRILKAVSRENDWLEAAIDTHSIDAVISDNRYGLYSERIPTVFMTHQLRIQTGLGTRADNLLQDFNYHFIDQFTSCWVPDTEEEPNLAGVLSHPQKGPAIPTTYIGPQSRFARPTPLAKGAHLLVILSGPEPQRSLLEALLLGQLAHYKEPVRFVRGLPGETALPIVPPQVTIHNHLPAADLEVALQQASLVISRCGYSTVMDLVALQKKSILIPTPGQTEQEYLAVHLMDRGLAYCTTQEGFELERALEAATDYMYYFPDDLVSSLPTATSRLLDSLMELKKASPSSTRQP